MNALAHALESLYAPDTTDLLRAVAAGALRALPAALAVAVARGDDLQARSDALYGAWLAGWSLGSTTMGLHHRADARARWHVPSCRSAGVHRTHCSARLPRSVRARGARRRLRPPPADARWA